MSMDVGTARGFLDLDISGFLNGLRTAQSEAQAATNNLSNTLGDGLTSIGGKITSAGKTLTAAVTTPIVGVGAAAVATTATFDKSMSKVQALSGATATEFQRLRSKAQEMGSATSFSASEAADAFGYMALAGWDTAQMIEGIDGVLNLAAASEMDLATASDIVTDYISAFGMEAKDAAYMADLMAYAQAHSNTSTLQLSEAFKNCAANMNAAGQDVETVTSLLEGMANQGEKGSTAGTKLRAVMRDLTSQMEDGAIKIGDTSVAVMDSEGNFRDLTDILTEVEAATNGMGDAQKAAALQSVFTEEAISGLNLIFNEGMDSISAYEEELRKSGGTAKQMADEMLNNLSGQLTILKSALEGLAIQIGDILMPHVEKFVEKIQSMVEWFSNLSKEQKENILRWAGIAAAVGPVLLVVGKMVTGAGNLIKSFKEIKTAVQGVRAGFTLLSGAGVGPILAVVAVVATLAAAFKHLWDTNEEFRSKMIEIWNKLKESVAGFIDGIKERTEGIKKAFENIVNFVKPIWEGFCELLGPVFEGAFSGIVSIISGVLDIILGIVDVFIGVFTGNWDLAWQGVKEVFEGWWNALVDFYSGIGEAIGGIVDVILGWFGTSWEDIIGGVVQWFEDTWNGIVGFWSGVGKAIGAGVNSIINFFRNLPGNILTFITNVINSIVEWKDEMVENAVETGKNFLQNIVDFFTDLPNKVAYFIGYALGSIVKWTANMIEKARETGKEFLQNIVNFFEELPGKILNFITNAWDNVKKWASDMVDKAKEVGQKFIDNIVSFFSELPGKILSFVNSALSNISNWVSSVIGKAKEAGQGFINNVVSFFTQLPGNVLQFLNSAISNVSNFVTNMKNKAKEAAEGFFNNIVGGLKSLPEKMASIGSDIVKGVWNGISGAMGWIKDKISGFAKSLLDGAKSALGINSPSKEFDDEFGRWIPPGAVNGVRKAMPKAIKDIQKAFDDGMDDLDVPTVTLFTSSKQAYENVVGWFESIEKRLKRSVDGMAEQLAYLMEAGQLVAAADGSIGYVSSGIFGSKKEGSSLDLNDSAKSYKSGTVINFYSDKKIDEIEAARLLKKTQRDISEGF